MDDNNHILRRQRQLVFSRIIIQDMLILRGTIIVYLPDAGIS